MDVDTSILGLFGTLKTSLEDASTATPSFEDITPPPDGISLLDVKNELLLSYLHNLVFLILLKIRQRKFGIETDTESLNDEVVKQLIELRVYLEKGVRPLEGRLKYQIDKVLRAADDATRKETAAPQKTKLRKARRPAIRTGSDDSDASDGFASDASSQSEIDELSYRPNPSAMLKTTAASRPAAPRSTDKNGIYKPPRIAATAMPSTSRPAREERRPQRSAAVDEYIATELSTAPHAEPSIGSTIVSGGRRTKSDKERREEKERQTYEETNFVRLPKETKAERAKKGGRGRERDEEFGGGFGRDLERISRLTEKKGGRSSKLDVSRKRAVEDGPRGDGVKAGVLFAKRRRLDTKPNRR